MSEKHKQLIVRDTVLRIMNINVNYWGKLNKKKANLWKVIRRNSSVLRKLGDSSDDTESKNETDKEETHRVIIRYF